MLGSPILYLKAMRILRFQLSGFYSMTHIYGKPVTLGVNLKDATL